MEYSNQTSAKRFILLELSSVPRMRILLFVVFLLIYVITITENLLLIIAVILNPKLHNPMYFFLSKLSFIDVCISTTILPKILANTASQDNSISFVGCATQLFFHMALGNAECSILTVMAYDRYNAICNPLQYTTIMNLKICLCLAAACWTQGFLVSINHTIFTFRLPYCKSNVLNHYYCEMPPLYRLSCKDTWSNEIGVYVCGLLFTLPSFLLICSSYFHIIRAILRIQSTQGRYKAFSTCTSHVTVVTLFFGAILSIYLRPQSTFSPQRDRPVSLVYTVVMPVLNPIIYSVRNQDIKETIQKAVAWMKKNDFL